MRLGRSPLFVPSPAPLSSGAALAVDGFSPLTVPGLTLWLRPDMDVITDAACDFNGSTQYLSLANPNAGGLGLVGTSFTIAAWVYTDGITGSDALISVYKFSTNERSYTLTLKQATSKFEFWLSNDGINTAILASTSAISLGVWQFAVVRYNHGGGSNNLKLSVNGSANATATHTGGAFSTTTAPFVIGADSNLTSHFDGRLDSVGIWNRELNDGEVAQLYDSGAGMLYGNLDAGLKTGLVSWWNLDEAAGNRGDSHGSNHVAPTGSPSRTAGIASGAAADEDTITQWGDQWGHDQFAKQVTMAKRPTLEATALAAPLVAFDGSDDELTLDSPWSVAAGFCWVWVADPDAVPGAVLGDVGAAGYVRHVSTTQVAVSDGTSTRTFTHAAQSALGIHIVNGNGSGLSHYYNGVASSASGTSFSALTLSRVGARDPGIEHLLGGLGDVLAFDRPLTTAELNKLGRYLAQRHQITWTAI